MTNKSTATDQNIDTEPKAQEASKTPDYSKKPRERQIRKIIPIRKDQLDVTIIPSKEALMSEALSIIGNDLAKYNAKTKRGVTLDMKEARIVQGYIDSLTKLSKEDRESARAEDLSNLSNEELLQLATQLHASPTKEES